MKLFERLGIKDAAGAAAVSLHEYLSDRSVALLLREYQGGLYIASGVAIQIGRHHLVATAAHNVAGLNPSQIEVIPGGRFISRSLPVRRIGSHPLAKTKYVDVAWLELEIYGSTEPGISFVHLNQIGALSLTSGPEACFVQGYPAEAVTKPSSASERPLVESDGFLTLPILPHRRRTLHQPDVDIAVEYPPHDGSLDSGGLPSPPGVSGGGVWIVPRFENHLIWAADGAKLVGLARSWSRADKELVATRIERWLEMLGEEFPDIRSPIQDAQARLQETELSKTALREYTGPGS